MSLAIRVESQPSQVDSRRLTPPHSVRLLETPLDKPGTLFCFKTFRRYIGPGWLMSLAFIDPGNIEADLQSGAFTGFTFVWVLVLAHLAGLVIQTFASRIAVVTGSGLAQICRDNYPAPIAWFLWLMTELAIVGSDVQEVIGSSIALNLLFGLPLWMGCLLTAAFTIIFLLLYLFRGVELIEYGVVGVIGIIFSCFATDFIATNPNLSNLAHGLFVPSLPATRAETVQLVAMIGSVVMPHNLFLHSAVISKKFINRSSHAHIAQSIKYFVFDALVALTVSFLINLALQGSFAQGLFSPTCSLNPSGPLGCDPEMVAAVGCDLADCSCITPSGLGGICTQIGLSNAGNALSAILPGRATFLFGLGLLAAGQASTLSGTMAGQFVMEGFLELRVSFYARMLITRGIALLPALAVALLQSDEESGMNNLSQCLNVLQSVQLPFALIPLLHFTAKSNIMAEWVVTWKLRLVGWLLAGALIFVNGYLLHQQIESGLVCLLGGIGYVLFLTYLVCCDKPRTLPREPAPEIAGQEFASTAYVRIL